MNKGKFILHGILTVSGLIASGSLLFNPITAIPVIGVIGISNYIFYKVYKK